MRPDRRGSPRGVAGMLAALPGAEDGAALIEAALVLPLLVLLTFGLTDVGLYAWTQGLASKAVQLGVRRAIVSDAVAVGPGLDAVNAAAYWGDLPPGLRCLPEDGARGACPTFSVACDAGSGCQCRGDACHFVFAPARLAPIIGAMRAVLPDLREDQVRITYATNGLGYVGRPTPVPVDVTVSLEGLTYEPLFLGALIGSALPLRASAWLPSEALLTR